MDKREKYLLKLRYFLQNAEAIAEDPRVSESTRKLARKKVKEARRVLKKAERKK